MRTFLAAGTLVVCLLTASHAGAVEPIVGKPAGKLSGQFAKPMKAAAGLSATPIDSRYAHVPPEARVMGLKTRGSGRQIERLASTSAQARLIREATRMGNIRSAKQIAAASRSAAVGDVPPSLVTRTMKPAAAARTGAVKRVGAGDSGRAMNPASGSKFSSGMSKVQAP